MQIHADSKGKVVPANHCTQCHGNAILRFHLIAHYVTVGEFFTGNYILSHSPHSGIFFDAPAITARNAFCVQNLNCCVYSCIRPRIWRGAKSSKWWPRASNLDLPNPKSIGFDIRSRLLCQVSSHSGQGFSFYVLVYTHTCIPTHPHTHIETVIAISTTLYYVVGADKNNAI